MRRACISASGRGLVAQTAWKIACQRPFSEVSAINATPILREFPQSIAIRLASEGFAIVDNIISCENAALLRSEVDRLAFRELLVPNETHLVHGHTAQRVKLRKRNIFEAEIHRLGDADREAVPNLVRLEQDMTICSLLNVYWPKLTLRHQSLKAQWNEGDSGCFPIHVDSSSEIDSRKVTALLYLNENWDAKGDGGQLRIYGGASGRSRNDVAPARGRLVLMSATKTMHRVLPCHKGRYALTLWCSGTVRSPSDAAKAECESRNVAMIPGDSGMLLAKILLSARYREHTLRIALADEWEQSLLDAHDFEQGRIAVADHRRSVKKIMTVLPEEMERGYGLDKLHVRRILSSTDGLATLLDRFDSTESGRKARQWFV